MSGINVKNLDPTGDLPNPDSRGRIVLTERNAIAFGLAAAIFFFGCLGLACVGVLSECDSGVIRLDHQSAVITWFTLCLCILTVTCLVIWLLFPVRLSIDDAGIALRKMAITSRLPWQDILEVKLVTMAANTNYTTVATETFTEVKGRSNTLSWDCAFPTNPKILADYLQDRAKKCSVRKVTLTNDPSSAIVGLMTKLAQIKQASSKILIGFLILFAVIFFLIMAVFKVLHPQIQL